MFTGIIEAVGKIMSVSTKGTNKTFEVEAPFVQELKVDQSVAHNGVCLTVEKIKENAYTLTAVEETLLKSNLGSLKAGDEVNIERCLKTGQRLDGHLVQGHVDAVCTCVEKEIRDGSWLFSFQFDPKFAAYLVEKGSVCLNGVSLTVFNVSRDHFSVTIIPYTYEHTNFRQIEVGDSLNIEFDIIGKYILRKQSLEALE